MTRMPSRIRLIITCINLHRSGRITKEARDGFIKSLFSPSQYVKIKKWYPLMQFSHLVDVIGTKKF